METKKSHKADLEKGKTMSLLMGLILSLSLLFVAFESGTALKIDKSSFLSSIIDEGEGIDIPRSEPPPPPPPPLATPQSIELNLVDDDMVGEQPDIGGSEIDPRERLPISPPSIPNVPDEVPDDVDFIIVEEMPEFPGGDGELLKFIARSINYPSAAQEMGAQGRVVCAFVIDRDGAVINPEVVRGVDPSLDKEALRVIGTMPKWKPGKQRGKPVRVKYTVPITFKLQK